MALPIIRRLRTAADPSGVAPLWEPTPGMQSQRYRSRYGDVQVGVPMNPNLLGASGSNMPGAILEPGIPIFNGDPNSSTTADTISPGTGPQGGRGTRPLDDPLHPDVAPVAPQISPNITAPPAAGNSVEAPLIVPPEAEDDLDTTPDEAPDDPLGTMIGFLKDMQEQMKDFLAPPQQAPEAMPPVAEMEPAPLAPVGGEQDTKFRNPRAGFGEPITFPGRDAWTAGDPIYFNTGPNDDAPSWTPGGGRLAPPVAGRMDRGAPTVPHATQNYYDRAAARARAGSRSDIRRVNRLQYRVGYNPNDNGE